MILNSAPSAQRVSALFLTLRIIILWTSPFIYRRCGIDYPKDKVIVHQFGKGTFAPSIGHFVLKLETYLRMAKIPYEVGIVSQIGLVYEPVHEISNNVVCATSKASDQPAHMRSLIRAFASRLSIL